MLRYPVLRVKRRPPKPRDRAKGIVGTLALKLIACSRPLGCPNDAYLHVGVGEARLTYSRELLKRVSLTAPIDEAGIRELARTMKLAERPFQRTSGRYVVFGSSVKGAARSWLELSFKGRGGIVPSCFIRAGRPLPSLPRTGEHGWRYAEMWGEVIFENRGPPCDPARGEVCVVCDLFGAAGLRGLLEFSHFELTEGSVTSILVGKDIEVEAANPGSIFLGEVSLHSISAEELGLLAIALGLPENETRLLGWGKYRAKAGTARFGRVHYVPLKLESLPGSEGELSKLGKFVDPLSSEGDELKLLLAKARSLAAGSWGEYLREVRIPEFE